MMVTFGYEFIILSVNNFHIPVDSFHGAWRPCTPAQVLTSEVP